MAISSLAPIGEGSETIREAGVHSSEWKRGAALWVDDMVRYLREIVSCFTPKQSLCTIKWFNIVQEETTMEKDKVLERFDQYWKLDEETGCWLWTASLCGGNRSRKRTIDPEHQYPQFAYAK